MQKLIRLELILHNVETKPNKVPRLLDETFDAIVDVEGKIDPVKSDDGKMFVAKLHDIEIENVFVRQGNVLVPASDCIGEEAENSGIVFKAFEDAIEDIGGDFTREELDELDDEFQINLS